MLSETSHCGQVFSVATFSSAGAGREGVEIKGCHPPRPLRATCAWDRRTRLVLSGEDVHPGGSSPTHQVELSSQGREKMVLPLNQVREQGSGRSPVSLPLPASHLPQSAQAAITKRCRLAA